MGFWGLRVGIADGAVSVWYADFACDVLIGGNGPEGDRREGQPNIDLKISSRHVEVDIELLASSREVLLELFRRTFDEWGHRRRDCSNWFVG